jgi:colanic acid biosynthesis glycosyl transferase WcaI
VPGRRVIFLNRSFYPDITATAQLLTELCESLVKDFGYQVTVIAGRPLVVENNSMNIWPIGKIIAKENFKGIEIIRIKNTVFSPKYFLGRMANYLSYFFLSFLAFFKVKEPDLIVALTDPPIIGLVGFSASLCFKVPLLISVKDVFPEAALGLDIRQNKLMLFFLDQINRFCLKKADYLVALGKTMAQRLMEKGAKKENISIISEWADTSKIFPVSKRNVFSQANHLDDFFVVMYSGNLGASSGLETLIGAARLLKDYQDMLFVFIGEGIRKDALIKLANNYKLKNIKFFSYQPLDTLVYSFSSADIFIITLKKGLAGFSLPSKVYPILASGRPYVASVEEESEIAQITREFNCGAISRPEDPQDLAEKILNFYKNKELRVKMGENARNASRFFDRNSGVKAYDEVFSKLFSL